MLLVLGLALFVVAVAVVVLATSVGSGQTTGVAKSLELVNYQPSRNSVAKNRARRSRPPVGPASRGAAWARRAHLPERHRRAHRALPGQGGQPPGVVRRTDHGPQGHRPGLRGRAGPRVLRVQLLGGPRRCGVRRLRLLPSRSPRVQRGAPAPAGDAPRAGGCPGHADRLRRGGPGLRRGHPPGGTDRDRARSAGSSPASSPRSRSARAGPMPSPRWGSGRQRRRSRPSSARWSRPTAWVSRSPRSCGSRRRRCASPVVSVRRSRRRRSP